MKRLTLLCLLAVAAATLFAQSPLQTVRGQVLDKTTQQPLIGATVQVRTTDPPMGTTTDLDGRFEIPDVPVGRHRIEATYVGYEPFSVEDAILNSARALELDIRLAESSVTMDEVVVKARSHGNEPLNELAIVSTRSFSAEETQRYAASANDPMRMARGFPGVQGNRDQRNDLIIRGNAGFGLLWRVEGIDIPNPNHFARRGSSGGGITIFSVSMLSNSDFSTGAFPAMYGNGLSGVFDIQFRTGNKSKTGYTFRAGMLGVEAAAEGPIKEGKSSFLFNYRYSTLGILDAFGIRLVDERESNTFQDLSFKLDFTSDNPKHRFSVWGMGGLSQEIQDPIEGGPQNWRTFTDYLTLDFDSGMGVMGATHLFLINEKSYLRTSVAVQRQRISYVQDTLSLLEEPTLLNDQEYLNTRLTLHSYYNRKLSGNATLRAGLIGTQLGYDYFSRFLFDDGFRTFLDEEGSTYMLQPYATVSWKPHPRWTFNGGLHALYFGLNETYNVEPRAGIQFRASPTATFNLGYGLHSRHVPLGVYFVGGGEPMAGQPNLGLELIKAHHLVLAYDQLIGEATRLRLEAYYQSIFDVPVSTDINSTYSLINHIDGFAYRPLVSEGTGENYGLDLVLEQFFSKGAFYILSGSLFRSTYQPLNGQTYRTRFDNRFATSFMGGKEWASGERGTIQAGLRVMYNGGMRISEVASSERDPFDPRNPLLNEADPFNLRVRNFFRPDLRFAYRHDNPEYAWSISLDVQNFIARVNEDIVDYEFDPDRQDWVFGTLGSIVPLLTFQIDW